MGIVLQKGEDSGKDAKITDYFKYIVGSGTEGKGEIAGNGVVDEKRDDLVLSSRIDSINAIN